MMDYLISYKEKNVLLIAPFKAGGVHADSWILIVGDLIPG